MFGLSAKLAWSLIGLVVTIIVLLVLVAWGGWQLYGGRIQRSEAAAARATDGQEAAKLETQGAEGTTRQVETYNHLTIDVRSKTDEARNVIIQAPGATAPLDPSVRDALRRSDEQLCQLGVRCVSSDPSATPDDSNSPTSASSSDSEGPVRPLSVAPE